MIPGTNTGPAQLIGNLLNGAISWFTGPNLTASGVSTSVPGIAVYNRSTLGGWWMVKMPNGVVAIVQQTDIGPAPWTGRVFDFTESLLSYLGYDTSNFPTNAQASGYYLGKDVQAASTQIGAALNALHVPAAQAATIMAQGDAGAFGVGHQLVAVSPNGSKVSSTTSTAIGSDVQGSGSGGGCSLGPIDMPQAFCDFFSAITSGSFWKLALYYVAGAILLFFGLKELADSGPKVIKVER